MEDIYFNIFIASAGGLLGVFFTHLFYKSKLKKEQRVRFQNQIGDSIARSLLAIREIEQKANSIEVYDIENELVHYQEQFDLSNSAIYPTIMHDDEKFLEFHTLILTARGKYGNELPRIVAAYLIYAEKYFNHLLMYLGTFKNKNIQSFGVIFMKDITDWQRTFDAVIVRKINSSPVKLQSHRGILWEYSKKRIVSKLWKKTLLKRILDNEQNSEMNLVWEIINEAGEK